MELGTDYPLKYVMNQGASLCVKVYPGDRCYSNFGGFSSCVRIKEVGSGSINLIRLFREVAMLAWTHKQSRKRLWCGGNWKGMLTRTVNWEIVCAGRWRVPILFGKHRMWICSKKRLSKLNFRKWVVLGSCAIKFNHCCAIRRCAVLYWVRGNRLLTSWIGWWGRCCPLCWLWMCRLLQIGLVLNTTSRSWIHQFLLVGRFLRAPPGSPKRAFQTGPVGWGVRLTYSINVMLLIVALIRLFVEVG